MPIVKSPNEYGKNGKCQLIHKKYNTYDTKYYEREYIEGVFVTRIKVNPTIPENLYFWVNDSRPIYPIK